METVAYYLPRANIPPRSPRPLPTPAFASLRGAQIGLTGFPIDCPAKQKMLHKREYGGAVLERKADWGCSGNGIRV